jgi:hypothetical protein
VDGCTDADPVPRKACMKFTLTKLRLILAMAYLSAINVELYRRIQWMRFKAMAGQIWRLK